MFSCHNLYYTLLDVILHLLVTSKIIPADLHIPISLDLQQPIMYILPYHSKADLLTARRQCLKQGLPDPLIPLHIDGITLPRYIFLDAALGLRVTAWYASTPQSVSIFNHYLELHRLNPALDVQLVPILVMFGRTPVRNTQSSQWMPHLRLLNGMKKFFTIFWFGRDSFVRFSQPLSLRYIFTKYNNDTMLGKKLARVARIYFHRQRLVASGSRLLVRRDLFNKLLACTMIAKIIKNEARIKNITIKKAQQNARKLMKEIAANASYEAIRFADRVLGWTWNRLYQGLHVRNIERVRQLAEEGHAIVYIPCHRSHMDYLLLSYVLYHEGLVIPHIAAGINLNFWPVGHILRRLGAFFIRRNFQGNKLYSTIVREYLGELFACGCSLEYFVEGGRSRTGRLLEPKTGTLTMTMQAMLRNGNRRPITLVPVYIGYEHVMEVVTYTKELRGASKEKEGLWQILCGLRKLRYLGQGYINFGDPLPLTTWLSQQVPHWRDSIDTIEVQRPSWLAPIVDKIATILMVRINNVAATNAINLCSSILLSSRQRLLTRSQLLLQLACYLQLLRNVPYTSDITVPDLAPEILLTHAIAMNKLTIKHDNIGDIIYLSHDQALFMTYYRNNILHLLVLPSLVACIICGHPGITRLQLYQQVILLYPLFKAELFMHYGKQQLPKVIDSLIIELTCQGLIEIQETLIYPMQTRLYALQLLANSVSEILQRYTIIFSLLRIHSRLYRDALENQSRALAQRLSVLQDINTQELFDKSVFATLMRTLRVEKYINHTDETIHENINKIFHILSELIKPDILGIIKTLITSE